jgi:hypothetical protein
MFLHVKWIQEIHHRSEFGEFVLCCFFSIEDIIWSLFYQGTVLVRTHHHYFALWFQRGTKLSVLYAIALFSVPL